MYRIVFLLTCWGTNMEMMRNLAQKVNILINILVISLLYIPFLLKISN